MCVGENWGKKKKNKKLLFHAMAQEEAVNSRASVHRSAYDQNPTDSVRCSLLCADSFESGEQTYV